ncbi:transposase [Patescibacteria group bacterium]|nr:transposase [Patescibacteria group bacterium]
MPSKNIVKIYAKDNYYHVYNRGVEKRNIFEDEQDYKVFLGYLKQQLSHPPDPDKLLKNFTLQGETFKGIPRQPKNFNSEIDLVAYSLMPNHFHFLLFQHSSDSMKKFMQSLLTRFSMYFNKRYERVGKLFQGTYKAVLVKDDSYLLHLSRYIHLNPSENHADPTKAYSSYGEYLGLRKTKWIKPDIVLNFFNKKTILELDKINSYKDFVENSKKDSTDFLGDLTLE